MKTVLVCGGRYYADRDRLFAELDALHDQQGIKGVINGGALGADTLARAWATERCIPLVTFRANWKEHGRAAGPMRNAVMLESKPDLVIAFPGGQGTRNMILQARRALVPVIEVTP